MLVLIAAATQARSRWVGVAVLLTSLTLLLLTMVSVSVRVKLPSDCRAPAIKTRAASDGTKLTTSTTDSASSGAAAASAASTAIVFITSDAGEGYITVESNTGDRNTLDPWHNGNDLVKAVAQVNKNTIVVVHSVGPVILESILALPNVVAVVWAGIPGQESGNGLVDVLYGSTSPSGKLP
jgi:beta-glucosidase